MIKFALCKLRYTFLATVYLGTATGSFAEESNTKLVSELCSTVVAIESALSSSIPLNVLPPHVAEEVAQQQIAVVEPLFEKAKLLAPSDVSDAVETYANATLQMLNKLDFEVVSTPEYSDADDIIDAKLIAECEFEKMDVTATSYEYLNIKETMQAGQTALTLRNVSDEVHEISISRINDDVDLTAREILMLGEKDALSAISLVGYTVVEPNQSETTFMNLKSGRYYAVCFTPVGTTSMNHAGTGPPHMLRGMLREFVVR